MEVALQSGSSGEFEAEDGHPDQEENELPKETPAEPTPKAPQTPDKTKLGDLELAEEVEGLGSGDEKKKKRETHAFKERACTS